MSYQVIIIPAFHTFSKFYQNLQIRWVFIIHHHHYSPLLFNESASRTPFHILFKVPRCVREGLGSYCVISTNEVHKVCEGHSWHFVIYCFVPLLKWLENHLTTCGTTILMAINTKVPPYNIIYISQRTKSIIGTDEYKYILNFSNYQIFF